MPYEALLASRPVQRRHAPGDQAESYRETELPEDTVGMNRKQRRAAAKGRLKLRKTLTSDKGLPITPRTLAGETFHEATAIFP